ncbi:NAD(P)-dependent oxidoreductase [Virgibacillus sp. DJP39]|uniref:NAD(P)-dependent oxidoreductase n=1 Tax=Virgibacillus sp. DJP39 TaxID=3409790 RepID=UPI003BB5737F
MKVGIIGIGNMGYEIARNFLEKGVGVGVFDINEEATTNLEKLGAKILSSPEQLAINYSFIITIVPNVNIVKSVLLAEDGLLKGFHKGSMLIEMTSSDPAVTKELASIVTGKGYRMIDAPVSGGVSKATNGTLTIMVGGEKRNFDEVKPLFEYIGENVVHVGDIGAGHTIKALNNMISATTLAVTGEALALGKKLGLDPTKMLEVINSSTGRSLSSEQKFPNQIVSRKFKGGFTLDLMVKDLTIAIGLADNERVPMQVSGAAYQLWKEAWGRGNPNLDHTTMVKVIEDNMDVEIK